MKFVYELGWKIRTRALHHVANVREGRTHPLHIAVGFVVFLAGTVLDAVYHQRFGALLIIAGSFYVGAHSGTFCIGDCTRTPEGEYYYAGRAYSDSTED
jgi:hypothetical protein